MSPNVLQIELEQLFVGKKQFGWNIQNIYGNVIFSDQNTPPSPEWKHKSPLQHRRDSDRYYHINHPPPTVKISLATP